MHSTHDRESLAPYVLKNTGVRPILSTKVNSVYGGNQAEANRNAMETEYQLILAIEAAQEGSATSIRQAADIFKVSRITLE